MSLNPAEIHSIAMYRALYLGDLLVSVPAWRALRHHFPRAKITLISLPWAEQFASRFSHYIDEFIPSVGLPGLPEQEFEAAQCLNFLRDLHDRRFDLLIQIHGNGNIINPLLQLTDPKFYAAFYRPEEYQPSQYSLVYPTNIHHIDRYLKLAAHLGCTRLDRHMEFPLLPADKQEFTQLGIDPSSSFVVFHPGAKDPKRRWHPKYFAQVADACVAQGVQVFFTGTGEEQKIVQEIQSYMKNQTMSLVNKTTLGSMAVLLQHARFLLSNDTGVSHLATALGVKSIVVSLTDEAQFWNPQDMKKHQVVDGRSSDSLEKVLQLLKTDTGDIWH